MRVSAGLPISANTTPTTATPTMAYLSKAHTRCLVLPKPVNLPPATLTVNTHVPAVAMTQATRPQNLRMQVLFADDIPLLTLTLLLSSSPPCSRQPSAMHRQPMSARTLRASPPVRDSVLAESGVLSRRTVTHARARVLDTVHAHAHAPSTPCTHTQAYDVSSSTRHGAHAHAHSHAPSTPCTHTQAYDVSSTRHGAHAHAHAHAPSTPCTHTQADDVSSSTRHGARTHRHATRRRLDTSHSVATSHTVTRPFHPYISPNHWYHPLSFMLYCCNHQSLAWIPYRRTHTQARDVSSTPCMHTGTRRVVDAVHTQADNEASLSTQCQDAAHAHAQTTTSDAHAHTGTRRVVDTVCAQRRRGVVVASTPGRRACT
jgi:hypothetical protein